MKRFLVLSAIALCSSYASASLYLEPYVGYEVGTDKGTANLNGSPNTTISYKDMGGDFGAKVGYSTLGFAVGADYMASSLTAKDQNTPATDTTQKCSDLGAFVQFTFPILLKVSATYFISSKNTDSSNNVQKGSGFKIGAGYTMLPLIAINFDLINIHYNDGSVGTGTVSSVDVNRNSFMLSVSLPLNIL